MSLLSPRVSDAASRAGLSAFFFDTSSLRISGHHHQRSRFRGTASSPNFQSIRHSGRAIRYSSLHQLRYTAKAERQALRARNRFWERVGRTRQISHHPDRALARAEPPHISLQHHVHWEAFACCILRAVLGACSTTGLDMRLMMCSDT